jgi:hypothetical protein
MTRRFHKDPARRRQGRPRLGDYRLETVIPQAAFDELKRREAAGEGYFARVAANILCTELIGGVVTRQDSFGSNR